MTLIYFGLKGNFRKITGNNEFVFYTIICLAFILISSSVLHFINGFSSGQALLNGAFQVVSIVTTTGYYHQDYNLWGNIMIIVLFVLMFTGGTAGSTQRGY